MNRNSLRLVIMLVAGAIAVIFTYIWDYSILGKLSAILTVLLVFYLLGSVIKWTLDGFDRQNRQQEERRLEEARSLEAQESHEAKEA